MDKKYILENVRNHGATLEIKSYDAMNYRNIAAIYQRKNIKNIIHGVIDISLSHANSARAI